MVTRKMQRTRYLSEGEPDIRSLNLASADVLDMNDFPDEMKLSAKLIKIMEPWIDDIPVEKLIDYAALAWNAIVDGEYSFKSINFLQDAQLETICDTATKDIISQIRGRKLKLFSR